MAFISGCVSFVLELLKVFHRTLMREEFPAYLSNIICLEESVAINWKRVFQMKNDLKVHILSSKAMYILHFSH